MVVYRRSPGHSGQSEYLSTPAIPRLGADLSRAGTQSPLHRSRRPGSLSICNAEQYAFRSLEGWQSFHNDVGATRTVVSMDGPEHIRMRREQSKAYSRRLIENRMDEAVRIVQSEIAGWSQDNPIPGQYAFQRIITRQLAMMATSTDVRNYIDDIVLFFPALLDRHFIKRRPKVLMNMPSLRRARRRVEELGQKIIAEHQSEKRRGKPIDYVDELLDLNRIDPRFMPETDLWISVLGPFFAGLDTVTSITSFMFYEL